MTPAEKRREQIFARIRLGLGSYDSPARRDAVEGRLRTPPAPLVPKRAQTSAPEQKALLRDFLKGQAATVVELGSRAEIPGAVATYLRQNNLPSRIRVGSDAYLGGLDWTSAPALQLLPGRAEGSDEVGLSRVTAAIAETGTLVLASGPDNPVTITFLPETHIVVLPESALVGGFEGVWEKLRTRFGRGRMSRTVNFVSGPSRTADIGGQLVMGAHGPRRLCVLIVPD